ncbi:MAG: AraC family transcriptional regulator [Saprospiraceae bacterium]|nr:AraC family transcriptional regulator [Saprospiraceae bacterium]
MKTIHIKNMVCARCILSVKAIFEKYDVIPRHVDLGTVKVDQPLEEHVLGQINQDLQKIGFQIIDKKSPILVSNIKSALIELYRKEDIPEDFKLSTFLTQKFPYDYSHLSRVFSQNERNTIEQYAIQLRIEKAKELLSYAELNISQIAYNLGYASVPHFSRQFKKLVGVSPSEFRKNPETRTSLENL